jgi:uncharacterized protein (DUF302 family)
VYSLLLGTLDPIHIFEKDLVMRFLIIFSTFCMMAFSLHAEPIARTTIDTAQPFVDYIPRLKASISAHKMGIVSEACATCGAKSIGVTIPGNQIIMIFNPYFAVRMLKASIPAGIEAPLRLYVTEMKEGTAQLSYEEPSLTFKPYGVKELDEMARELDQIVKDIVQDSL